MDRRIGGERASSRELAVQRIAGRRAQRGHRHTARSQGCVRAPAAPHRAFSLAHVASAGVPLVLMPLFVRLDTLHEWRDALGASTQLSNSHELPISPDGPSPRCLVMGHAGGSIHDITAATLAVPLAILIASQLSRSTLSWVPPRHLHQLPGWLGTHVGQYTPLVGASLAVFFQALCCWRFCSLRRCCC
jgi:hypothetical protein